MSAKSLIYENIMIYSKYNDIFKQKYHNILKVSYIIAIFVRTLPQNVSKMSSVELTP